jgi:hypothetical protein
MRGGDDADPLEETLGRPFDCDCRLDERICVANCSGRAGLGGISDDCPEPGLPRSTPEASSTTLGLRFFAVSGSCSVLDLGVEDADPFFVERPLADFHDLRIDLRTLFFSGGALAGTCGVSDEP